MRDTPLPFEFGWTRQDSLFHSSGCVFSLSKRTLFFLHESSVIRGRRFVASRLLRTSGNSSVLVSWLIALDLNQPSIFASAVFCFFRRHGHQFFFFWAFFLQKIPAMPSVPLEKTVHWRLQYSVGFLRSCGTPLHRRWIDEAADSTRSSFSFLSV